MCPRLFIIVLPWKPEVVLECRCTIRPIGILIRRIVAKRIIVLPLPHLAVVLRLGDGAWCTQMVGVNEVQLRWYGDADGHRHRDRRRGKVIVIAGLVGGDTATAAALHGEGGAIAATGGTDSRSGAGEGDGVTTRPTHCGEANGGARRLV